MEAEKSSVNPPARPHHGLQSSPLSPDRIPCFRTDRTRLDRLWYVMPNFL